jgi:hypothetical protein
MTDLFDFGFTVVDESELDISKNFENQVMEEQVKLQEMYNAIMPLLKNLKSNPDKDYIKWPNRVGKIEAFEKHLIKIMEGE